MPRRQHRSLPRFSPFSFFEHQKAAAAAFAGARGLQEVGRDGEDRVWRAAPKEDVGVEEQELDDDNDDGDDGDERDDHLDLFFFFFFLFVALRRGRALPDAEGSHGVLCSCWRRVVWLERGVLTICVKKRKELALKIFQKFPLLRLSIALERGREMPKKTEASSFPRRSSRTATAPELSSLRAADNYDASETER